MITLNGLGWQTAVQQYNRAGAEQPLAGVLPMRLPVAPATATPQQNNQSGTSGQNTEDARKEAFAKLMVMLQNPDVAARQQASVNEQDTSGALEAFRDYMAKSPEEKIKEKYLAELGLSEEEYNALPPEQKEKIDQQIAQRMQEDVALKTQAKMAGRQDVEL
ncbi:MULTISPECIES: hypothetical protein [Pseudomonas]|uniref:Uncharacterized protein n=1 Tax=Pseudomonas putida TaxID=303 RepID=A0A1B2F946_PSEPU|nr:MULTISPECIES: hypothetical protein [Pseudomonas]ANY88740.1 hypothetical protein IEC33019_3208 [Pseudomonas putida]MCL8305595.1 hypothetical protein [Pseudomonas putida]